MLFFCYNYIKVEKIIHNLIFNYLMTKKSMQKGHKIGKKAAAHLISIGSLLFLIAALFTTAIQFTLASNNQSVSVATTYGSPTPTATESPSPTASVSPSPTASVSPSPTASASPSPSASASPSPTAR